jgi:hypothetical protein
MQVLSREQPTNATSGLALALTEMMFGAARARFHEDQLGYSRALGGAEKSATLPNVVRLRYADTPIVLQATQVISGYQHQRNVTGGFEAFPAANPVRS